MRLSNRIRREYRRVKPNRTVRSADPIYRDALDLARRRLSWR